MELDTIKQNLVALKDYLSKIEMIKENSEVKQMKLQLHMIEKAIKQMNKSGIPVLQGLISDKESLETKISGIEKGPAGLSDLYEELLDAVEQLGTKIQRRPRRDLYNRMKRRRKEITNRDILQKSIIKVLREAGGSGYERDVLRGVEEDLKNQFTAVDLEKPYGRSARWEMNTMKERNQMVKDGILTQESKRKKWSLKK